MKQILKEMFGRGYSMSYRWYRLCEMFGIDKYFYGALHKYYELNVIPAIVLGCLTSLLHYVFSFIQTGTPFVSP